MTVRHTNEIKHMQEEVKRTEIAGVTLLVVYAEILFARNKKIQSVVL